LPSPVAIDPLRKSGGENAVMPTRLFNGCGRVWSSERLEDWVNKNNPVRVIDLFVDELDLGELGFDGIAPEATGRPSYHPSVPKLYIYGYLNWVQSSRRLEREAGRNVEVMWLTGRLSPDHKTIADFRKDNGGAIRKVCAQFVMLCRRLDLFADASVVIDGSKSRHSPPQRTLAVNPLGPQCALLSQRFDTTKTRRRHSWAAELRRTGARTYTPSRWQQKSGGFRALL
jgi:transposase